jgi:hypothetical protein
VSHAAITAAPTGRPSSAGDEEVIAVDQRATAIDVIDICPDCLRTMTQHAEQSCEELDAIEARLAYAQLPFWRRLRMPAPKGWRARTPAPKRRRS